MPCAARASAADRPLCGLGNGQKATGEPILVGSVVGETGPDDFSAGADAARAYFNCVNENGGINGRPIEFLVEDDQWKPEVAAQVASKLVKDKGVVALVGNGSFVEMTVNAKLYEDENVAVVASACAVRECFEAKNIASTNQGPVPSNISAVQWAVENLGTKKVACVGLNIPSNGVWSCNLTNEWLKEKGLEGVSVLMDPGAPDPNASLLEAVASGADTILMSLPAGLAQAFLKAAQDQDLRDQYKWISPTPLYKQGIPEALGDYWSGKVHVAIELTPWDGAGPDGKRWLEVMDKYGRKEDPRDTFSQAGFASANIFVDTLHEDGPQGHQPGERDQGAQGGEELPHRPPLRALVFRRRRLPPAEPRLAHGPHRKGRLQAGDRVLRRERFLFRQDQGTGEGAAPDRVAVER